MLRFLPHTPKEYYRWVVSAFFFVLGLIFASWASRIPNIKATLDLSDAQLGTALFAAPLGQFPAMLVSGFLVNRFGSRKILVVGVLLYAVSLVCLGLAPNMEQLFISLLFFGMASNLFGNAVNTQAVGVEKLYQRSIMASFHGLWSLGGVAGGIFGAVMAGFHITPFIHFLCVFLLALLLLFTLLSQTLPRDVLSPQDPSVPRKRFVRPDALLILLGIIAFGSMATEGAMYDWSSVYFATVVHAPARFVSLGYITCMCFMVIGRFVADGLIIRCGAARVLQLSGVCMSSGLVLLIAFPYLIPATLGSALVGYGMASCVPICFSLAGKSRKMPPSIAISMVNAISFWGFMLCPPVIGYLSQAFTLRWALVPIACMGVLILVLAPFIRKCHD